MKKEIKIFMDEKNQLYIKDGKKEYHLNIFCGGGYYSDFLIMSKEEIEDHRKIAIKQNKEEMVRMTKRLEERASKKLKNRIKKLINIFGK